MRLQTMSKKSGPVVLHKSFVYVTMGSSYKVVTAFAQTTL